MLIMHVNIYVNTQQESKRPVKQRRLFNCLVVAMRMFAPFHLGSISWKCTNFFHPFYILTLFTCYSLTVTTCFRRSSLPFGVNNRVIKLIRMSGWVKQRGYLRVMAQMGEKTKLSMYANLLLSDENTILFNRNQAPKFRNVPRIICLSYFSYDKMYS